MPLLIKNTGQELIGVRTIPRNEGAPIKTAGQELM